MIPRFFTRVDFDRRGFTRARPRALDPLILRRGGDVSMEEREEEAEKSDGGSGVNKENGGRGGETKRTAGQTTPALLEHADTGAKARLHHPTRIDTSIVLADGKSGGENAE